MIPLRKLQTIAKLVLLIAPAALISGCASLDQSSVSSQLGRSAVSEEPGAERLVRYCRRMAETSNLRIAIGVCQRALEADPGNPQPVLILAEAYAAAERRKEAAEAYEFALMIDNANGDAHFGLGKLYLKDRNYSAAKPHLLAALDAGKKEPGVFNAIGILYDQLGQHAEAQAFYRSGLEIEPGSTALANNLGVSLVLSKDLQEGVTVLGALRSSRKPNLTSHSNLETAKAVIDASSRSTDGGTQVSSGSKQNTGPSKRAPVRPNQIQSAEVQANLLNPSDSTSTLTDAGKTHRIGFYIPQHTKTPEASPPMPIVTGMGRSAITALPPDSVEPVLDPISSDTESTLVEVKLEIPAAPVESVVLQALPPLPARKPAFEVAKEVEAPAATPVLAVVGGTLEAVSTQAVSPKEQSVAAKTSRAQRKSALQVVSSDPITIIPRRKPTAFVSDDLLTPATRVADTNSPSSSSSPTEAAEILYVNVPHLPIEMPGFKPEPEPGQSQDSTRITSELAKIAEKQPRKEEVSGVLVQDPSSVAEHTVSGASLEHVIKPREPKTDPYIVQRSGGAPDGTAQTMADTPSLQEPFKIAHLNLYGLSEGPAEAFTAKATPAEKDAPPVSFQSLDDERLSRPRSSKQPLPDRHIHLAHPVQSPGRSTTALQEETLLSMVLLHRPPNAFV